MLFLGDFFSKTAVPDMKVVEIKGQIIYLPQAQHSVVGQDGIRAIVTKGDKSSW